MSKMSFSKKIYLNVVAMMMFLVNTGFAANDNSDPLKTATETATKLTEHLTGPFALAFLALVITLAGLAWMADYLSKKWAINIIGGAALAGGSVTFAKFFFSG